MEKEFETKLNDELKVIEKVIDPFVEEAIKNMKDSDIAFLLRQSYQKLVEFEERITILENKK